MIIGFGFVIYANHQSVNNVLTYPYIHSIRNKLIECKIATPREMLSNSNQSTSSLDTCITSLYPIVNNNSNSRSIKNSDYQYSYTYNESLTSINSYFRFKLFDLQGERLSNILVNSNKRENNHRV